MQLFCLKSTGLSITCRTGTHSITQINPVSFSTAPLRGRPRGLGAHSTWLKPWGTQSGHLTLCIHNTFTPKMHLPISAVVFIWLVVLEIYTHVNTRKTIKKKRQGHARLERWDENWQKVLILVTDIREIFFILLWCQKVSLSGNTKPHPVCRLFWGYEFLLYPIHWTQMAEPTPKWSRWVLEPVWPISKYYPWMKKTTKQVQSKHQTAEGTDLMRSIRKKLNILEKN